MGEYHGPVSRSASLEIYSKWALTNRDQFRPANERGSEVLGIDPFVDFSGEI
jgi:hypothetical protein